MDLNTFFDGERIPERVVHAKGIAVLGYFEVTNNVSKYTSADVFNGIGKKTPVTVRFSSALQNLGGTDLARGEFKGMSIKFYTRQGNLDLLCLHGTPYLYTDALLFSSAMHAFKRNTKTNLYDPTAQWDMATLRPSILHPFLILFSDYGVPDGYRKMDAFPIHTYELSNKNGETHYVRFNFRTEQGLANLTAEQIAAIQGQDLDYYNRDLINAISRKDYPSWRLEMDLMTSQDIRKMNYNPFDVTLNWKKGTYKTIQIGRLVLDQIPQNNYRVGELSAFNPGHLVPGIPGPVDIMFKGRRVFYRDTQNYRLGVNHNKIDINLPYYTKTYGRDGVSPVRNNMRAAPNYFPNSFNGPAPYVDLSKPKNKIIILESNAVDLQGAADFYNQILVSEGEKQRLVNNIAISLERVTSPVLERVMWFMNIIDKDLGRRVTEAIKMRDVSLKK